jgi:hypothetical protein
MVFLIENSMRKFFYFFFFPFILLAQEHKTPEQIQEEFEDAEKRFEHAKELFNPYYTGPLITPSAAMIPPGHAMIQPYVIVADNYAVFNNHRKSISLPSNLVSLILQPIYLQTGVTDTVDTAIQYAGVMNWQSGEFGGGLTDLQSTIGFIIYRETLYVPQFKFTITETFPTGKYKNLSTNGLGLNGIGGGAFATQFGLATSKVLFWSTLHPFRARAFVGYTISTSAHVENFNSYGGGFGTHGTVHPGKVLSLDLAGELSLTQKWVLALDIVYKATNRRTFNGHLGVLADGTPATVAAGYKDNLSLAPAIEYNWSSTAGFIGGAWFSVYGRNTLNFAQAILSFYMFL